jgi:transposase
MTVRALCSTAQRIQLLAPRPPGCGPSWSGWWRRSCRGAGAALAGANPIPASSGQVTRHRLNRSGDRQLNRALHTIVVARLRDDPATRAYAARRRAEGKSARDIRRCLKRAVARQLFKLLERCDRAGVEVIRAG